MSSSSSKRSCSRCNYCCIHLEIESKPGYSTRLDTGEDIAKAAKQRCAYLGPDGCTIYEVRPLVCRQFRCDWLLGVKGFGPMDSPIETGILGVRGDRWLIGAESALVEISAESLTSLQNVLISPLDSSRKSKGNAKESA